MFCPWLGTGRFSIMGGSYFTMIFWILLIIGVIYLLFNSSLVNNIKNNQINKRHREEKRPIEIAKKRYAAGEIEKEELEEIKRNID